MLAVVASVAVSVPERVTVPATQTASIALVISDDRSIEGTIVDVTPEAGVSVKKRRLGPGATFEIAVRGEAAGEHAVAIRVRYWACRAHACWPVDVRVKTIVVVTDG
ncbi:MAG TPA: hypothetical protein VGM88_32390 [Kofleriaceae bacterium]|jgi:hypothetical protein